jgi:hypothetical protein
MTHSFEQNHSLAEVPMYIRARHVIGDAAKVVPVFGPQMLEEYIKLFAATNAGPKFVGKRRRGTNLIRNSKTS